MSRQLISRSDDLQRLETDGYHLRVTSDPNFLVVHDVPYVTTEKVVKRDGVLVMALKLGGDRTEPPDGHTVDFIGERPCDQHGQPLNMVATEGKRPIGHDVVADFEFSRKPIPTPNPPFADYYDKVTFYIGLLGAPAQVLDPSVSAQTHPVIVDDEEESVFRYADNASGRAGIGAMTAKLKLGSVGIVGLGGTGSYVLDFVAKTPVKEIHLFDGDTFFQHNAFRAPGAATLAELEAKLKKVAYLEAQYDPMRRGIVTYPEYIDADNADALRQLEFVFVCMDDGDAKRLIVDTLESAEVPFVDVGMGVQVVNESLTGIVRVSASTPTSREGARRHISFSSGGDGDYDRNIQIAELNALNAALAVMRWKKLCGFYADIESEQHVFFTINDCNIIREGTLEAG